MTYNKLHIFKGYNLISFDTYMQTWKHHHTQVNKDCIQSFLMPICNSNPSQPLVCFLLSVFIILALHLDLWFILSKFLCMVLGREDILFILIMVMVSQVYIHAKMYQIVHINVCSLLYVKNTPTSLFLKVIF